MSPKLRVAFDSNALVSALLFEHSPPGQAFYAVLERGDILLSRETFAELSEVLERKKFDRYVTKEQREHFLVMLLDEATLVEADEKVLACRDPKDNKFLELAISGSAACLVTGDEDLLVLNPFRGVPIMTPVAFLSWLEDHHPT
ncbi:MAG TPA: putative toxin-antitoxin system toxin component, PIN family [Pirellulaceae bacterium]